MPTLYEDTNAHELRTLLAEIHNGSSVLPEFQRDFVWDAAEVAELILSVASNFPAGSILRIRNNRAYFASRGFDGAPQPQETPTFLVLDGQQRQTSLYQAFYGVGPNRFFIDFGKLIAREDLEDALIHCRADKLPATRLLPQNGSDEEKARALAEQAQSLVFPLGSLRGGSLDAFNTWKSAIIHHREESKDAQAVMALLGQLDEVAGRWIAPINAYRFPVVTLSDQTSAEAICTIFETLNRTGVKLSPFELLTARFFPQNINLRTLWSDARQRHPIIAEFELDPYVVLQAITLRVTQPISVKRGALMDLTGDQIRQHWDQTTQALSDALTFLREECGVTTPKWLPYGSMLAPLCAIVADHPIVRAGADAGARRARLKCWFWSATLGQHYESSANSRAELDVEQLRTWFAGGAPPNSVASFQFDSADLERITPRQRATYRALMCLVMAGGARDFHSNQRMSAALMRANGVDDHHLFPLDYLGEQNRRSPNPRFDNILNRTLIDAGTNRSIGANNPADYLAEIDALQGREQVNEILASHGIAADACEALRKANFDAFLQGRRAFFTERVAVAVRLPGNEGAAG